MAHPHGGPGPLLTICLLFYLSLPNLAASFCFLIFVGLTSGSCSVGQGHVPVPQGLHVAG